MHINKIDQRLKMLKDAGKKALIPFITCGDPNANETLALMKVLETSGADIIELGVPFSDPMADGPVIQKASERALKAGMTLKGVLNVVKQYRDNGGMLPIVLMGYANPIERMGVETFAIHAKAVGVDGVLIVDYPPEESLSQATLFKHHGLAPIFLISPTTTEHRIQAIAKMASGYIYYVSVKGITGSARLDINSVADKLNIIRHHTDLPLGVGFGINTPEIAGQIARIADAVVIGSKLIQLYETAPQGEGVLTVQSFIKQVRYAIDNPYCLID